MNTNNLETMNKVINYVILEDEICYDWDDYCLWGATLYDIATGKVFTTKYGHGTDMSERAEAVSLNEAIEQGIVNVDTVLKNVLAAFPIYAKDALEIIACGSNLNNPTAIPVTVKGGRKFKGNGYIVYAISEPVRYGLGAYHNEYNHYPVVLNPENGTFNKVNSFGYCEFNIDNAVIRENIFNNTPHTVAAIAELAHWWAYNMSYSACDTKNARYLAEKITARGLNCFNEIPEVVTEAIAKENARIAAEKEAKMNEKLPKIIEWVKANTDKTTEEDILALAKHIYHKYND